MTRYVFDTFTDTDGVLLPNHTPEINVMGGGYTAIAGVWDILSNEAKTSSVLNARVVIDSGIYDGQFGIDMKVGMANNAAYLIFRSNAACTNYWVIGLDDATQRLLLYSVAAGVFTLRAQKAFTQDEATWYRVKAVLLGDDIKAYVNDALLLSHTSALYNTQTVMGFYAEFNPDARFDSKGGNGDGVGGGPVPDEDLPGPPMAEDRLPCAYCTVVDIKNTFGAQWTSGGTQDSYLGMLISMASYLIDRETGWRYCHYSINDLIATNRHYDTWNVLEMQIDRCLDDASFAVSVDEQSNGTYVPWVRNTDYIAYPLDERHITKVVIKSDASKVFSFGQRLLRVTARWGGFATPPSYIQQACIITVSRWFKRGLQQFQDTAAIAEVGQLTYTKALDPDVIEILRVSARRIAIG